MRTHTLRLLNICLLGIPLVAGCGHTCGQYDVACAPSAPLSASTWPAVPPGPFAPSPLPAFAQGPEFRCPRCRAVLALVPMPPRTPDTTLPGFVLPAVTGSAPPSPVAVGLSFSESEPPAQSAAGRLPETPEAAEARGQIVMAPEDTGVRLASLAAPPRGPVQPAAAWLSFGERVPSVQPPAAPPVRLAEPTGAVLSAEPPPRRESFADLTAAACFAPAPDCGTAAGCFAHAPDYSCISGQVEYCPTRNEWQLRYASVDEGDRYGGRMVLMDNGQLRSLSDGQNVRVEGRLIDDRDPPGGPGHYEVRRLTPLSPPDAAPPR